MYYPNYPNYDYSQKMRDVVSGAFNPQYQQPQVQPMQPVCFNVSSVDEVRSFRIDPMSTYVFVDNFNNKIYTKKMGINGSSEIQVYTLDTPPTPISNEERMAIMEKRLDEKFALLEKISSELGIKKDEQKEVNHE